MLSRRRGLVCVVAVGGMLRVEPLARGMAAGAEGGQGGASLKVQSRLPSERVHLVQETRRPCRLCRDLLELSDGPSADFRIRSKVGGFCMAQRNAALESTAGSNRSLENRLESCEKEVRKKQCCREHAPRKVEPRKAGGPCA